MKVILVTGAPGFIGRHTLPYLTEEYERVHAVYNKNKLNTISNVQWHRADILNKEDQQSLLNAVKPTHLLHLAWYAKPGGYARSFINVEWLHKSLNLIRQFRERGGERVVCAGSCFEYSWKYGNCSEFITPRKPNTIYGICKNSLQELLHYYSEQSGLSSAWGRIFYLYGPNEYSSRLVASVILSLIKGQKAKSSLGEQQKDFLHVEDVARAFVMLLNSRVEGPVNIGSGVPRQVRDVVLTIGKLMNKTDQIQLGALPTPENEPPLILADNRRLRNEVQWKPEYDLEAGLKNTIHWWMNNHTSA